MEGSRPGQQRKPGDSPSRQRDVPVLGVTTGATQPPESRERAQVGPTGSLLPRARTEAAPSAGWQMCSSTK